jgi:hypothetical protein
MIDNTVNAQNNNTLSGGEKRRDFLMPIFLKQKPGTYSFSDLAINLSEAYAIMDYKDSAFYYLKIALDLCPSSRVDCKEFYTPDIISDVNFVKWKNTPQWKNIEKKINEGFDMEYGDLKNKKLAYDIFKAIGADQSIRFYIYFTHDKSPKIRAMVRTIDSTNLVFIKKVIDFYGFPSISMVGKDASADAFLLCQHADNDIEFQKKMLVSLTTLADKGEAKKEDVAYLTDRIMVKEKGTQKYGTQFKNLSNAELYPIEDSANVDARRRDMGLPPLYDYLNDFYKQNDHLIPRDSL